MLQGVALSRELAELVYDVDYYVHVDTKEDAVKLVTHMPYQGHVLTTDMLNPYACPVVEQSINQLVQVTPLEQVNERIHDITELVRGHLRTSWPSTGAAQRREGADAAAGRADARADLAARVRPVRAGRRRYYVAMKMAERGLVSAPNMAVGEPFNIGLTGAPVAPAGVPDGDIMGSGAHAARPGA